MLIPYLNFYFHIICLITIKLFQMKIMVLVRFLDHTKQMVEITQENVSPF